MKNNRGPSLPSSVLGGLLLLLAVAVGARVAYQLLAPLVPTLTALVVVAAVGWLITRRR